MMSDSYPLDRFVSAQNKPFLNQVNVHCAALSEINSGKKRSHWMWYIFPQIDGLGLSELSKKYSIKNSEEAISYLQHELLGTRLIEITENFLSLKEKSASDILGRTDALKMKSCMTLFDAIQSENRLFHAVLQEFYDGAKCERTLLLLTEK